MQRNGFNCSICIYWYHCLINLRTLVETNYHSRSHRIMNQPESFFLHKHYILGSSNSIGSIWYRKKSSLRILMSWFDTQHKCKSIILRTKFGLSEWFRKYHIGGLRYTITLLASIFVRNCEPHDNESNYSNPATFIRKTFPEQNEALLHDVLYNVF